MAVGQLQWVQQQARIQSNSSASSSGSSSSSSTDESGLGVGLSGQSVIYVGLEGRGVVGALGFSDTLRPDSRYVVQQLLSKGIRVVVLSGLVPTSCVLRMYCVHANWCICKLCPLKKSLTCFGQPTGLITCARTHGPDKSLVSTSHSNLPSGTIV